jgi:hypothetical protein
VGHFVFVRRRSRVAVLLGLALGLLLLQAVPAGAMTRPGPRTHRPQVRTTTDLTWNGVGPGEDVSGFTPNPGTQFDPTTATYPTSDPTSGWSSEGGFAGIIHGHPTDGSAAVQLYCIDIHTFTYPDMGYGLGTWDAANVPNVGYVALILNEYFPNTGEPASLPNDDQRAAAVQAAIWFFSDSFVLSASSSLHAPVAAIVAAIQKAGPLVEPPAPSLAISPSHLSGPAGGVVGPFTVTTSARGRRRHRHRRLRSAPDAAVNATGGTMYSDPAGTVPIGNGSTVTSGTKIYLRSSAGSSSAVLQATATATVPSGNVYLYDGTTEGVTKAQKLILAETATLSTTVQATAEFLPVGSLVVTKNIAGPASGSHGRVVIEVDCHDGVHKDPLIVPAGSGTMSKTYSDIPAETTCTVTETSDGGTDTVLVHTVVAPDGGQVPIHSGQTATVDVTDTYDFVPGALFVRKTIAGPGAGHQGAVTIQTKCNGKALTPDFVIAAGTPAGEQTKQYTGIPAKSTCTVTETADGHTSTVSVVVEGSGQAVTVPAAGIVEADISDTYGLLPGQFEVTKTIAGPQAGQQGPVVIHTVCTPAPAAGTPDFVISAGATGDQSHIYSGVPAGASCAVTETADGHTSAVSVVTAGSPHTTTVPAGGAGAAHITDTYGAVPGSLLVTKTIAGPFAGHQGPVTIHAVCNGIALSPDFVIAAGTPAGNVSHSFDGIPAGSVCTVTETADGATATVTVTATVSGDGQTVTIPAGKVVPVSLMDVYQGAPGFLGVIKDIRGPAARLHGRIAILVACGGPLHTFAFLIPSHKATGSVSRSFAGLPAGARCTVFEVAIGRTHKVVVVAAGRRHKVTIRANRRTTVHLADTFRRVVKATLPQVTG